MKKAQLVLAVAAMLILFAPPALARESIGVGKSLSLGLPTGIGGVTVTNTNPQVVSAQIQSGNLLVTGLKPGIATVAACGTTCVSVDISVGGAVLGETYSAHAPGTWVIQGKTVYYVSETGLIPITTWQIFVNNGGKASLIQPINDGDMHLPFLSFMTLNDSRVK